MKKKISSKWLINYLIGIISIMLIEIIFKLLSGSNIFNWSLFRIFVSSNILIIIFSFIVSLMSTKAAKISQFIFNLILTIYSIAQLGFNNFIGVYMSLNTTSQLGAVKDYVREYIKSFKPKFYIILIPYILLILYYIFLEKRVTIETPRLKKGFKAKFNFKKIVILILLVSSLSLVYYSSLTVKFMQNKFQIESNKDLFINPSTPSVAVQNMGIITFGLSDARIKFFPVEEKEVEFQYHKSSKKAETDYTRYIDDTAFENVIGNETNKTYQNLNNYFISRDITDKNEYTGLFKDKNVIVLMLESVNDIIIDEELYPNFYKMYKDGWHWENNYSPRNSCSTGNNELSGMTSLYSIYNSCTANIYKNNKYFEGIFNVFNDSGYYTTSMHDYTEGYYYRKTIHPNIGAQKYYGVQDLKIPWPNEYRNWTSDVDFMTGFFNILDTWDPEVPFMTWLTTVSSHQPYSVSSILGDKYLDLFSDKKYPTDLKRYMSKVKELDNALGDLLAGLEERNLLEDTVIVMYGDHYPYGLSNAAISNVLYYDLEDYENERVPFVIYNSSLESKTFTEYTSYINILPTIANLFDLNYDPRFYMGQDLLSKDYESITVFADGSWKNEHAYYNAAKGKIDMYVEGFYTEEEINRINEDVNLKIKMSNSAIKSNYFDHLDKALEKEKEKLRKEEEAKRLEEQQEEQNNQEGTGVKVEVIDDTLER